MKFRLTILTPLTYLGGVFYSISLLPERPKRFRTPIPPSTGERLPRRDVAVGLAYSIMIAFVLALYTIAVFLLQRGAGIRD